MPIREVIDVLFKIKYTHIFMHMVISIYYTRSAGE